MKKIKKGRLEELSKIMPTLSLAEQKRIIAGDNYLFNSSGVWYDTIPCSGTFVQVDGAEKQPVSSGFAVTKNMNKDGETTGYSIEGADMKLFEYMADNSDVEWGMSYNGNGKKATGYMSTNNKNDEVDFIQKAGFDSYVHSHPGGSSSPSGSEGDLGIKALYGKGGRYSEGLNYKYWSIYYHDEDGIGQHNFY